MNTTAKYSLKTPPIKNEAKQKLSVEQEVENETCDSTGVVKEDD